MKRPSALPAGVCALLAVFSLAGCRRPDAATPEQMTARIQALERERDVLQDKMSDLIAKDRRLAGMPGDSVRVGVPTPLARSLVQKILGSFVDSLTLKLSNLKVHKAGSIKKVVALGEYELDVAIDEVTGKLQTGKAQVDFGGNRIKVGLPVRVVSGTGDATIDFKWDGKGVGDAVCGDMEVHQKSEGT